MNQIVTRPNSPSEANASQVAPSTFTHSGEVIPPGARCRVFVAHPLRGRLADCTVQSGCTVREALAKAMGTPTSSPAPAIDACVNGEHVPAEWWDRVRLKPGVTAAFIVRLQGRNAWRTVLGIAVAVGALILAPYLAPGLVSLFGTIGLTVSTGVAQGLIGAGIVLAGTMAINALFPVRPPQLESSGGNFQQLNSVQGAQNQASPYGPIPVVLGRHRQSPVYAAKPYTEIIGEDQWLRLLFCWGYGPIQVSDLKIGETPLATFVHQIEHRVGFAGDNAVTLYPGRVDEVGLSIALHSVDDWQGRTTETDTDEVSFDVTAPEGIYRINQENGNVDPYTVQVGYEVRTMAQAVVASGTLTFTRKLGTLRIGQRVVLPARGQYWVYVRKLTTDQDATRNIKDSVVWTALRSINNEPPITFGVPLALTALRIKATDQVSGVIDTFNGLCEGLGYAYSGTGGVWDGASFSNNPADLIRRVLQSAASARPVAASLIDLSNLQDFWTYCFNEGFAFNQVRSQRTSVYNTVADIAAAARARPSFIDGKWAVVWDRPGDPIVQHFTPRNSWGFSGNRSYVTLPHGWRVKFINGDNGYTQDERIVYDDGWDQTSATLFEGVEFPGVTDPDLIWRLGRFHIAQARLRPEEITLSVGWENIVCQSGDRVRVTHDVMLVGLVSGRVKSVSGQDVTFDEVLTIDNASSYAVRFRSPAGAIGSFLRSVDMTGLGSGEYTTLPLVGDLSNVAEGLLFGFGETGAESAVYRVKTIKHQQDLVASLVLVDDAPAISSADEGEIPPYEPNVTIPPDPFTLPPRDLSYLELIDGQGASARAVVRLTWQVPRFGRISSFQVQSRDDDVNGDWLTVDSVPPPRLSADVPLISAGIWSFRVRCIFSDGTASDWVTLDHLALEGLSRAPDPVENLRHTYITGRSHLVWDRPLDPRTVLVEIRKGESFEAAQIVDDDAVSPWQTLGDDTYWVTTYVNAPFGARIYGDPKQSIEIANSVALENIVVSHDERAEGFTGYFSGTVGKDTDQNYLRTSGGDSFLDRPDFLGTGNFLDQGPQGGGYYWSRHVVNIGRLDKCRISNDWTATGVPADDDFLGNPDFLANPDFLKSYLSQYIRVRPVVRISRSGPGDAFAEANIFEPDDAFFAGTDWEDPVVWSPDVYEGWIFQLGMQFELLPTDDVPDPGAIAYLLSWVWTIDVPDRLDSYQALTIPIDGLHIEFRPNGAAEPAPFNGGLNNEPLPHLTPSIRNPDPGDLVVWENLSLSGVRLFVKNGGVAKVQDEVNLFARGY